MNRMHNPQKRADDLRFHVRAWLLVSLSAFCGCSPTTIVPASSVPETSTLEADSTEKPPPSEPVAATPTKATKPKSSNVNPPPIERYSPPKYEGGESASGNSDVSSAGDAPPAQDNPPDEAVAEQPTRGKKKPGDVPSTLKQINAFRETARRANESSEPGKAFREISKAWEAARSQPKDPRCRALVEELAAEMRELGPRANDRYRNEVQQRPLVTE